MALRGLEQVVPSAAQRTLELHAERRRQGIPTVSGLLGPAEPAVGVWRDWLGERSAVVVELGPFDELADAVARAWLQPTDQVGSPGLELPIRLAAALARECPDARLDAWSPAAGEAFVAGDSSAAGLAARLQRMSALGRRHFLAALAAQGVGPGLLALATYEFGPRLLEPARAAAARERLLAELACSGEPGWQRLVRELARLWPEQQTPGMIVVASGAHAPSPGTPPGVWSVWIDRAVRSWLELAEREPRLPLGLTLESRVARIFLAQAQGTRVQVRLQNALIWLPEPAAAPADTERVKAGAIERTRAFLGRAPAAGVELSSAFESAVNAYRAAVASAGAVERAQAAATGQESVTPEAADRARSQAERVLFLALERAPETRGLFVLNQRLDVRFGRAPLEIDLYCATLCLAVEVDGYYHFRDLDAYRRDRRKDLLLQSLDHMVVRCLAEDVVLALEQVLEVIAGALATRRRRINDTNDINDTDGLESE